MMCIIDTYSDKFHIQKVMITYVKCYHNLNIIHQ